MAQTCRSGLLKRAAAAMLSIVAAVLLACPVPAKAQQTWAQGGEARTLAAELLICRGDLVRLDTEDLPERHRTGLGMRIQGSLGLLPWMLRRVGDDEGADRLRAWQGRSLDGGRGEALGALLQALSRRHALNDGDFEGQLDTPTTRREARVIHETYCAACHDGLGSGDPDLELPARDLFVMAGEEAPITFLARLLNGVKGTADIRFENPLTNQQIAALWRHYRGQFKSLNE